MGGRTARSCRSRSRTAPCSARAMRRHRSRSAQSSAERLLLLIDPGADVVRALARSKLDDPEFREAVLHERIVLDDRLDLGARLPCRDDDAAVARDLAPGDDECTRRVVLLEERHVRAHLAVDRAEGGLV